MNARLSEIGQWQQPSDITRLMSVALERPDILSLAAGFTDTESLPIEDVTEIVGEISDSETGRATLQYGSNFGRSGLRALIKNRIESFDTIEGNSLDVERLYISNGSQQALYLAIQTLCDAGDYVLVEQPTYFVFLEILRGLGIRPLAMPMGSNGEIDLAGLDRLLQEVEDRGEGDRIKAIYLVSYFANPSGHSISEAVKSELGELLVARTLPVAIIEDAAYRELFFEKPFDARSCLSIPSFGELPILYTSTLTKPYASGLKVGYAYCTDGEWLASMLAIKGQQDFGTANFAQAIVEGALESGRFDTHLGRLRAIYRDKGNALDATLAVELRELGWSWEIPSGGLYLWLTSPSGLRTDSESDFHRACIEEGVFYVPGDLCFSGDGEKDKIRLSFGSLSLDEIREAGSRFIKAARLMTDSMSV